MTNTWVQSALWIGLALMATLLAIWFGVSSALSEIVVGTVAQLITGAALVQSRSASSTTRIALSCLCIQRS